VEPTKSKSRFGFTIVEMLLVTILIVLLVGAAGGIYARTHKKALVRKSARDFLMAAKYARILAIERQSECKLKLDITNDGFALIINEVNEETEETEQLIIKDLYFKPIRFAENVKFEDVRIKSTDSGEDQENVITFLPDGTATEAVVQVGDGENHYTVCVSAVSGKTMVSTEMAKTIKSDTVDLDEE